MQYNKCVKIIGILTNYYKICNVKREYIDTFGQLTSKVDKLVFTENEAAVKSPRFLF